MYYGGRIQVISMPHGTVVIKGFPLISLTRFTAKKYRHKSFMETLICGKIRGFPTNSDIVTIWSFFLPELVYILESAISEGFARANCKKLLDAIYANTWFTNPDPSTVSSEFDMSVFGTVIKPGLTPLPVQMEFLRDTYCQRKKIYNLKGHLLSLPPGSGKTFTSLFLAAGLHKKKIVVIAPLSTVTNVWVNEINAAFVEPKKIATSVSKDKVTPDTDIVVINYEAIENYTSDLVRYFGKDAIVIVDECHNFKDIGSKRTIALCALCDGLKSDDILLMSGTPVKAFGTEALPILRLLTKDFNVHVSDRLRKLQRYTSLMNELMCHRLGFMMFRRTKEEVIKLPPKYESDILIKIPNGKKYTVSSVTAAMQEYQLERRKFYESNFGAYEADFDEVLRYFQSYILPELDAAKKAEYNNYLKIVKTFRKSEYDTSMADMAHQAKVFEDTVILPSLPNDLKRKFKSSRAVVKYVSLKILGEALGNVIGRLRMEMTSDLMNDPRIRDIIYGAEKKTILFSSYADTLNVAAERCKEWGLNPMVIDGSNSKQAKELVDKFKEDESINPLIASLQVMSTGHTLNEANTVIFLNVPFRSVDYEQASDRCYRIGQDTEVYVYRLILDTGEEYNLSTRMHDIMAWSKKQFTAIMGDDATNPEAMEDITIDYLTKQGIKDPGIVDIVKNMINNLLK